MINVSTVLFWLMVYDLNTYGSEGLPFHSPSPYSWVRSLRLLTSENRVVAIRTWRINGVDQHSVEVYDYINTAVPQPPVIFVPLGRDGPYTSFMISEPTQMTEFPAISPFPRATNIPSHHLHPPISIYAMRQTPRSIEHYLIWALDADSVSPTYQVQSSCFIPTSRYIYETFNWEVEMIPAVHRPWSITRILSVSGVLSPIFGVTSLGLEALSARRMMGRRRSSVRLWYGDRGMRRGSRLER
ncbi:hypothetical protein CPB85DRAFT_451074 [Mucidula mucida]|nr:hypothetical protein CPB85DRAFT_451074 [Mucidula mucida]